MTISAKMHPNALKLSASFIPTWTHKTTLALEGHEALQEDISAKRFITNDTLQSYYIQGNHRIASVLAKHLRLSGQPVVWSTMAGALREQQVHYHLRDIAPMNPIMSVRGTGYIVIPDFYNHENPSEVWAKDELEALGSYLSSHVYAGGALVLGGMDPKSDGMKAYGDEIGAMINTMFSIQIARVNNV